jgi:hypothetical protein
MGTNGRSVDFAGGTLGSQRNVCAFFNSIDEEHRVLGSFIKDGFKHGDKAFHIVDPEQRHEHLRRLCGSWDQCRTRNGHRPVGSAAMAGCLPARGSFDQDAMLSLIEEVPQSGPPTGYPLTRPLAHMEWALLDKPGINVLVEYEIPLNYVLPKYEDVVVCTYDLSKFSASLAMDITRTHPVVIIGSLLQENPFFVPPDRFLLEIRGTAGAARECKDSKLSASRSG